MSITNVNELFDNFKNLKVLIIGDVMLDAYLFGKVERISPEAPVPIVSVSSRENRLGGAANVALNIRSLGAVPFLCSVVGNDEKGQIFNDTLLKNHISSDNIVVDNERITTTKFRVIGNNVQLLRVDEEITSPISSNTQKKLLSNVKKCIDENNINCIIFQDYDKGVLTPDLIFQISELARLNKIITVVDPKKKNFLEYKDIDIFKPNYKEFCEGLKITPNISELYELFPVIQKFQSQQKIKKLMLTLSENGILLSYLKENTDNEYSLLHIPAHVRTISDVSGAGDTVISTAALCLSSGLSNLQLSEISNLSGGIVCQYVGVVPIDKNELISETSKLNLF